MSYDKNQPVNTKATSQPYLEEAEVLTTLHVVQPMFKPCEMQRGEFALVVSSMEGTFTLADWLKMKGRGL